MKRSLSIILIGLALAGCGRSGDRANVQSIAEGFYAAAGAQEGARACTWLSADARQALEQDESEPCGRAVEQLKLSGKRARRVEVYSTNAAVAPRGGDVVYLEETPQGWRVSAAGCSAPAYTKPATCELES